MPEHTPYQNSDEGGGNASPSIQADLVRSYAAFVWRAIRPRLLAVTLIFGVGLALTSVVNKFWPRTYSCTTVLMAQSNPVLDQNNFSNPLANAPTLITRQENREQLVRETGLVQKYEPRRPTILRLKDRLTQAAFGKWSDDTIASILVGTLQSKLSVGSDPAGNLTINVDWSDGKTAQELAQAAREGFLRGRHATEISAYEARMSILDEHASKMREEVENLAQQINAAHEERAAQVTKNAAGAAASAQASAAPAPQVVVRRSINNDVTDALSAELPERKAKLTELKRQLSELENERERRLREEQTKLAEMQLHLTPSHPQVVTQQERIALLSNVPSDMQLLRSQVADLEGTIRQREAITTRGGPSSAGGTVTGAASAAAGLPVEIIQALENDKTDPALSAQISGAVVRYGTLRDEIRAGRMELDTVQAAFDHRYQIVVPAEVPTMPTKPKPFIILGGGIAFSLLLALGLPILLELRRGIIIERWQVHQMQLPVLAELRLPPHSVD